MTSLGTPTRPDDILWSVIVRSWSLDRQCMSVEGYPSSWGIPPSGNPPNTPPNRHFGEFNFRLVPWAPPKKSSGHLLGEGTLRQGPPIIAKNVAVLGFWGEHVADGVMFGLGDASDCFDCPAALFPARRPWASACPQRLCRAQRGRRCGWPAGAAAPAVLRGGPGAGCRRVRRPGGATAAHHRSLCMME